jgi:hypothetical protein
VRPLGATPRRSTRHSSCWIRRHSNRQYLSRVSTVFRELAVRFSPDSVIDRYIDQSAAAFLQLPLRPTFHLFTMPVCDTFRPRRECYGSGSPDDLCVCMYSRAEHSFRAPPAAPKLGVFSVNETLPHMRVDAKANRKQAKERVKADIPVTSPHAALDSANEMPSGTVDQLCHDYPELDHDTIKSVCLLAASARHLHNPSNSVLTTFSSLQFTASAGSSVCVPSHSEPSSANPTHTSWQCLEA